MGLVEKVIREWGNTDGMCKYFIDRKNGVAEIKDWIKYGVHFQPNQGILPGLIAETAYMISHPLRFIKAIKYVYSPENSSA